MTSSNYSNLPSVVELRAVRDRNEFRWKRMGMLRCVTVLFALILVLTFENAAASASESKASSDDCSGKIARLPWSFKPEQARGVCVFRTQDEGCGQIVWQIGIGHCDTKTKPKRLIISDVDGEQIKVISPKGSLP